MRVLVACEYSAIVRDAFRAKGHDAWSCDILPTEGDPAFHIKGDVLQILDEGWDLMIAHPPCTYLANSGAKHLYKGMKKENGECPARSRNLAKAAFFFAQLMDAPIRKICIENPIMLGRGQKYIGAEPSQIIRPWQFGNNESKSVCLWLKYLPPLKPEITEKPGDVRQSHWRMPPGPERQKERSRFFPEIAKAMADQWTR